MPKIKDPNSKVDYLWDWSDWLKTGDTIQTSVWTVPAGLVKESEAATTTTTTVWLSGGTLGETYLVTNRITTVQGRIEDHSMQFIIRDK